MSKENSYFKSIFSKKNNEPESVRADDADDYTVAKNRKMDIAIRIFSVVCAIIIWVYAMLSNTTTKEFHNISVTLKRQSMVSAQGYDIQYEDLKVNFKIEGLAASVSQIKENNVEVYADLNTVDLTQITSTKVVRLPLIYNLPAGITCTDKSQEYIEVFITKIDSN